MPDGVPGLELAEQLRQRKPHLKIIYTSGYSPEVAGRNHSLDDGVNFLPKPFDPSKLVQTVRAVLDQTGDTQIIRRPGAMPAAN